MYYTSEGYTYYRSSGEQYHSRAPFLLFLQPKSKDLAETTNAPIRCVSRKVALRQCGHWMMGRVRIGREWYGVSGAYGADGLTMTVNADAYHLGIPLPADLYAAWNTGGGWNGTGTEAPAIAEWARKTFA